MNPSVPAFESPWQTVSPQLCALGESPFWQPKEQLLYWLDIAGRQVLRTDPATGTVERWDMPSEPGCMAPAASGGLVIALRHGVFRAHAWGGELQPLVTLEYDPATMRANDGKCDALGRFWVGTIDETRQLKNAGLYCIDARPGHAGDVPQVDCKISPDSGLTTANGLAWSPDKRTLYWADTPSHRVWAWDFELGSAAMSDQRVFARFEPKPPGWQSPALAALSSAEAAAAAAAYAGRPDGAAVDVAGNYWVAMYEGQRVCQFAPDGTLLACIPTPLQCPTMPCFGGADLKTLFLTSASQHRSAPELAAWPLSGSVLSLRVELPGLPVNFFVD
jgi:sugar lactone lactonase YvrE